MNTKLKLVSICSILNLISVSSYAENLVCPTAQEVMKAADPATGIVTLPTPFGTLTGTINTSIDSYVFANAAIPVEKVGGQSIQCSYFSPIIYPLPIPLTTSTSSVFSPVVGNWQTSGSYSVCTSQSDNPKDCQFAEKTLTNVR